MLFRWLRHAALLLLTLCTGLSTVLHAEVQVEDSRTWRKAQLISGGQQVWGVQSSYEKISDRFNSAGQVEPLGRGYARAITWGELVRAEASAAGKAEIKEFMNQKQVADGDIAASSTYELERENVGFSVDWAYGLTRRWMIGFQIPLVMRTTRVRSNVELTPTLATQKAGVAQNSVLALSEDQMRERVKSLAAEEMSNRGYDEVPDERQSWDWGDVSLMSQFYLYDDVDLTWSLQQMVRFPSSRNPSVADYFQQISDDGQTDLGVTSLVDYQLRSWTLGWRLGYVAQLPDSAKMRVGEDPDVSPNPIDPKVSRDLGDWVWGAVDAEFRLTRSMGFDVEYAFLSKTKDVYSSVDRDLSAMSEGTDQQVQHTRVGMSYQFQGSARRGVEKKWVATLGYTYPWTGKNSADASRSALEIISYF